MPPTIRPAADTDLEAMNAIYNREVREGIATWELDEWSSEQRLDWFRARDQQEPVLVAEQDRKVIGFAYLSAYRGRRGYRFTREDTIWINPAYHRQGVGRALIAALIEAARALDVHVIVAVIDEDNPGSIALHRGFGFQQVGNERETGHKFGQWRSSVELTLVLDPGGTR